MAQLMPVPLHLLLALGLFAPCETGILVHSLAANTAAGGLRATNATELGDSASSSWCHGPASRGALRRDCPACHLQDEEGAPRLFIKEPKDGLGSRMQDIITGMAVAARNGMNFGGVVFGRKTCHTSHGVDVLRSARLVLGLNSPEELFTSTPPRFDAEYTGIKAVERAVRLGTLPQAGANIFLSHKCVSCDLSSKHSMSEYFTPRFLNSLREHGALSRQIPSFVSTNGSHNPTVVIHLRRGDVSVQDELRATPDQWYYDLMSYIRKSLPAAEFRVFSSTENKHATSEFTGYEERGATVHLDGDVLEPWVHFASADIFVMAKSSFSHVPALLNSNCVIYQTYWHRPLPHWIVAADADRPSKKPPVDPAAFAACVARLRNKTSGARRLHQARSRQLGKQHTVDAL